MAAKPAAGATPELSKRRTTLRFIRTLLWKNWLLKRRHIAASVLEVALPCLFVVLLSGLKHLVADVDVPAGWSDDQTSTSDDTLGTSYNLYQSTGGSLPWIPGDLPKFTQYETSLTGLLLYLSLMSAQNGRDLNELSASDKETCIMGVAAYGMVDTNTSSAYAVPSECDGRVAPYKLAIVPDTAFTRAYFLETLALWYPRVSLLNTTTSLQIPSLAESVTFFDSEEQLETYVKGNDYGSTIENPRIYGGIVFDAFPDEGSIGSFQSIEYTLRLNSTTGSGGVMGRIPSTNGDPAQLSPLEHAIETDYYTRYALTGFMTLQTLVTRFVTCMPEWDAVSKTTTGKCQLEQSTAASSSDLDDRLLSTLDNDVMIAATLSTLATYGGGSAMNVSFAELMTQLDNSTKETLLAPLRQAPQPYLGSSVAPFPVEAYIDSGFYDDVSDVIAIIFIMSYLYPLSRVLVVLIQEKELRLREFMKILGMRESAITMSWYMTYTAVFFLGSLLQALTGLLGIFANSSVVLIFLFFFLFGLSVLSYCFMVSTVFSDARLGAFVGMIVFFLMHFVASAFSTETPESKKTWGCLLSPVALSLGIDTLSSAESTGTGITFSNVDVVNENFRFSTSLWMLAFDSVIYTLLGLYLDKVVPKQYGTTLPWNFPISPKYWINRRQTRQTLKADEALLDDVVLDVNPNFEPVNSELREQERHGEVLSVQRLRKVFDVPGGEKVAVKGLNLTMYKNQITCLLGHNGAGKTTLISMLTGMTAPTSGNAVYNGKSINDDMAEIRESLGICFQHDVLYSELTVEEHLLFFGRVKGYTDEELRVVVDKQIREVGLTEKRHVKSNELSGGMKRKLSVAVSLLGDSSLVFLDEPTSGMDPYSRRSTWEILLNNRNDRVMVLTTHFMDEADILGDRIAIMAEGEVRCCGSSLFLKNRFGAGYNLTLVKDDERCNDSDVIGLVTSFVPSAQLLSNVGSEIAFQLPLSSSPQFAELFGSIDDRLIDLGLLSYGVSVTTLEEVFIKVAEQDDEDNQHTLSKEAASITPVSSPTNTNDGEAVDSSPHSVFFTQLRALILKRFRYARRDRKSVIFSTVYPITLLLIGLVLLKNSGRTKDDPALALNTDAYDGNDSPAPFYCQGDIGSWCGSLVQSSYYSGASLQELSIDPPAFESDSPTVFGVQYSAQTVNASDATGYGLRLGEVVYDRGYGIGSTAVQDQYGAYLVYGDSDRNVLGYNVFVNSTAAHSPIIFKALMDQAVYRFLASNLSDSSATSVELKVNNHPLPLTASAKTLFGNQMAFSACVFIGIAFTYFTASIVVFLVKERQAEHNSKHQQLVSGVSLAAFWLSNYVYDLLVYVIPFASALILIKAFDISTMTGSSECYSCTSETFPAVIVLFVLFGFAVCPFTYCLSYLFKEHASSQTYTIMINLVIGVVLMVVSYILDQIDSTKSVNSVLVFFWRLSPLFDLGNGLLNLVLNEANSIKSSSTTKKSPFSTDIMGYEMIYLVILTIVYGALAVGIDYAMTFPSVKSIVAGDDGGDLDLVELDVDVENEAARVARGDADNDVVKLANLRKVYPGGKVAVRDLSFGLKRGECFGFLGINGAGKTTTMKMLTGDELPTHGKAALGGFDILTQQIEVRRQIGYCPQFDALFDKLTVREHLELFAAIKGIRHNDLEAVVMEKIHQMNLADFENKLAGSLSGGNKRKLSVAIAMIGNPRIIFLDEPSTGMDPVSRRFMWDVIAGISTRSKSSTIVLTTHSMEEAEALCSRVGIMVGGRLRCLGSTQHLKSRFGDGFAFDVKLSPPTPEELERSIQEIFGESGAVVTQVDLEAKCHAFGNAELSQRVVASHPTGYSLAAAIERDGFIRAAAFSSWCIEETRFEALRSFLETTFGLESVVVMERQNDFCRFKLRAQDGDLKLSKLFALIEEAKTSLFIREYSVSQTTLEQIFNGFASQQQEEQGVARGVVGS